MKTQRSLIKDGLTGFSMPMDKFFEFYSQFEWLKKLVGFDPRQIYVQGFSEEFFTYMLAYEDEFRQRAPFFDNDEPLREKMWFLDKDGEIISKLVPFPGLKVRKKYWIFGPLIKRIVDNSFTTKGVIEASRTFPPSVINTIKGLEEKIVDIRYVLSYFPYTRAVIIYRVPSDKTFLDLMPAKKNPKDEIAEEIAAIDAGK